MNIVGINFKLYNAFYVFLIFIMTKIGLEIFIPDKTKVATYIKLLFKYSIFITLPITLYNTNIIAYLIYLKDMLLPFIISMFLIYKFRYPTFEGVYSVCYLLFNILFSFFNFRISQ